MTEIVTEMVNDCVGCPPELGCNGSLCPYYPHMAERVVYCCDACGAEVESQYDLHLALGQTEEAWVCESCLESLEQEAENHG